MNRIGFVVTIVACTTTASLAGTVSVEYTRRSTHPALWKLVAERNSAVAAGDLELARSVELRIQGVLKRLHPLPQGNSADVQVRLGGGCVPESFDPDVLIDTCRIRATAADYELNGAMYAAGNHVEDNGSHIYKSEDHGESWRYIGGFVSNPPEPQEKIGLVVGEGDSALVYGFLINPTNNGDLWCVRFDTGGISAHSYPVLVGSDTVTDFAVCRDYSGGNYWLYAVAANELGGPRARNDYILRSVDYGKTWAVVDTTFGIFDPHLTASAGTWMYHTHLVGPEDPGTMQLDANAYYMSPDSFVWTTIFFPDTFGAADPVAATSFEVPADSATLWMMYSFKRTGGGNWDICYFCSEGAALPNWGDSVTLAGDPDLDERFPDIRSYTFRGSPWINASYISEDRQFRAVQRRHAHSRTPTQWSDPMTLNFTSAGTGSGVRPKLCYTPGGPGTGGGAIFTGSGLLGMYWNAPWRTAVSGDEPKAASPRTGQTICCGTLLLSGGQKSKLLDITGRKVMDLPGALASGASGAVRHHDIRHIAPGVYFVREEGPRGQGSEGPSVRKVVIQR
ncbi:MAG: hypothetical protein JSU73_02655 [candidate division WOR-3 bacterium]|nr:MAG: hypothetical protein JSU73_02655 [candidate division WOR-3 bacterium]